MHTRLKVAVAVLIAFAANGARAQGIPVIDIANLIQTVQQVLNDITEIGNQVQQITQLQNQLNSINGVRNLGNVFNNPMLKNYVPAEAYTYLNAINTSGYSGLNGTAIFLNETAKYAHVLLPGSSFLEKDGTFTNAERRISRVRQVMPPLAGLGDWEVTMKLSNALGYPMHYAHPEEIMQEIAALTPSFAGVSYAKIERLGSVQWPCNEDTDEAGTSTMHVDRFVRGKGRFFNTQYVASQEKVTRMFPLLLTTGRVLSQYNVGAQTRRTPNNQWHDEDRLELHPHDAQERGIVQGDWVGITSRAGQTVLRAEVSERMQPGVVYTTFHFPESGANVITTDSSDWATNCPEYKVTAVQVAKVMQPSDWQRGYADFNRQQLELLAQARHTEAVGK